MKKIAITLMAGLFLIASLPVMAETTKAEKDECLLLSKNCATEVDSLQKKVKKLQTEIKKGTRVYTADELKTLENKLKEVNDYLNSLNKPGR